MNKALIVSCLILVLSTQGLQAHFGPSFLVQCSGGTAATVFNAAVNFHAALANALFIVFSPVVIIVETVVVNVIVAFSATVSTSASVSYTSVFTSFNTILASIAATSSSISASISGASSLSLNAQVAGVDIVGIFSQASYGIGHCASALAAIAAGQKPKAPNDIISDSSYDLPFPDLSGFPTDGSQASISVQVTAFVAYVQYMIVIIQNRSLEYEELRNETICSCDSVNTTNVQSSIDAWNNVSVIVNASASVSGTGSLIAILDTTFSTNLTIALQSTNYLLNNITSCSLVLTASIQQGNVRSSQQCPASGSQTSFHLQTIWAQQEKSSFTRKCHLAKKQVECSRRKAHLGNKSLFNVVRTHTQTFCDHISSVSVTFLKSINAAFSATIKASLSGFYNFIIGFNVTLNATFTAATNVSLTIIATAQQNITAAINNATDQIALDSATFASEVIGDAPTFPLCQGFLNLTIALFQNASANISACANQSDPTFNAISANLTLQLSIIGDAFNNFTTAVDNCLHQNCWPLPGFMCFNAFFFAEDIAATQQCIDSVNASANAYAASLSVTLNATLVAAQAASDNATKTTQTCVTAQLTVAESALVTLEAQYTTCKASGNTTTTVATTASTAKTTASTAGTTASTAKTTASTAAPTVRSSSYSPLSTCYPFNSLNSACTSNKGYCFFSIGTCAPGEMYWTNFWSQCVCYKL